MEKVKIGLHEIGEYTNPFVIAEIGANHNGDMDLCEKLIHAAKEAGAHAVKFQSWSDKTLISEGAYKASQDNGFDLKGAIQKYQLSEEQHKTAKSMCDDVGVIFSSTAFSPSEVDLLESLHVLFHKVASMDITHYVLLKKLAETKKPILLSTGMATLGEIESALEILNKSNSGPVILLHCVSVYPPRDEMVNLKNIEMFRSLFSCPVGFSDHTIGVEIPLASVALGACVIEKHFTLDRGLEGWDHAVSAIPSELKQIVMGSERIVKALGGHRRIVSQEEQAQRSSYRRSIVINKALPKGSVLQLSDLDFKRPGNGLSPSLYEHVLGMTLVRDIDYDHQLSWNDLV